MPLPINDDPLTISRMLLKIGGMHWIIWALKILLLIKVGFTYRRVGDINHLYTPGLDFKHDTDMEGRIKVGKIWAGKSQTHTYLTHHSL